MKRFFDVKWKKCFFLHSSSSSYSVFPLTLFSRQERVLNFYPTTISIPVNWLFAIYVLELMVAWRRWCWLQPQPEDGVLVWLSGVDILVIRVESENRNWNEGKSFLYTWKRHENVNRWKPRGLGIGELDGDNKRNWTIYKGALKLTDWN